jgi:hypothetical protein
MSLTNCPAPQGNLLTKLLARETTYKTRPKPAPKSGFIGGCLIPIGSTILSRCERMPAEAQRAKAGLTRIRAKPGCPAKAQRANFE